MEMAVAGHGDMSTLTHRRTTLSPLGHGEALWALGYGWNHMNHRKVLPLPSPTHTQPLSPVQFILASPLAGK